MLKTILRVHTINGFRLADYWTAPYVREGERWGTFHLAIEVPAPYSTEGCTPWWFNGTNESYMGMPLNG